MNEIRLKQEAMQQPPLVSIIVAVYNVEQYLPSCIDSVLEQDYTNIEILLIDDGSKDKSGEICDRYAAKDKRITVVHKPNGGLSDARNAGIARASGSYLMFVDGDDCIAPNITSHLLDVILSSGADIAICDLCHVFRESDLAYTQASDISLLSSSEAIAEMLYQTSFLFSACAKLFKINIFDSVAFPVGVYFEDVAAMGRLFEGAKSIAYSNARLYAYLHRENSITTSEFGPKDLYILEICRDYEQRYLNFSPELRSAVTAYGTNCCLRVFLNAPNTEEYSAAKDYCERYIREKRQSVISDDRVRRKLKCALLLHAFSKTLLRLVYSSFPRWS